MMKPTIGRIVYYKALNGETYAAIVSAVHTDTVLGLHVMYPSVNRPVTYLHKIHQGQDNGTWDWMPFQKDQAKRYEQEEK